MGRTKKRTHRGFTLIELVIVITILAILAAVAIPAFQNLVTRARNAGTQGAVGGLRSGIAVYRANELANGRAGAYPAISTTTFAAPSPMENGIIPENPWARSAGAPSPGGLVVAPAGSAGSGAKATSGTTLGWAYDAGTGIIYANSAVSVGCAGVTCENNY